MKKEELSAKKLMTYIVSFVGDGKSKLVSAFILRIMAQLVWLYPPYAFAAITTFFATYTPGEPLTTFWYTVTALAAAVVGQIVFAYIGNTIAFPVIEKAKINAILRSIRHLALLDIAWHEKENTGNKVKQIERGGEGVNNILRTWIGNFTDIGVSVIGITIVFLHFDAIIASVVAVFMIMYFFISKYYTRSAIKARREEHVEEEALSGLIHESVNNIRTVKIMSMMGPIVDRLSVIAGRLNSLIATRVSWFQKGGAVKNSTGWIFRLGLMMYIALGISQGKFEVGFMILFYSYFSTIQESVNRLADVSQELAMRRQDVGKMIDILEMKPTIDLEEGKVPMPKDWKNIDIKNLSFAYGDNQVLKDVSFSIARGEKIGIVGLSGAGKSTLFKLLLKERENYEGDVSIDGVPLKTISKTDYFKHAAVVLQETEVFNFSLKNNISLSDFDKNEDEQLLQKALNVAHVSEFVAKLPQGIDTLIGEKGIKLSGGEKQRVGVARAIFKQPELLLLDEATSHLDVESEEKIQDSLHTFFKSVTAIVIAHRLTTIKEMDKILVMEDGKIIEQGNFAELYKKKGRFFELWEKQKLSE